MAFDKVVDSAVLESGLTSIANAIREKAGTSDALAFPAGFAEAIAAIESGGSIIGGASPVATGKLTAAEDIITSYSLPIDKTIFLVGDEDWNSDRIYNKIACIVTYEMSSEAAAADTDYFACAYAFPYYTQGTTKYCHYGTMKKASSGYSAKYSGGSSIISSDAAGIDIPFNQYNAKAGRTYRWIAWRADLL